MISAGSSSSASVVGQLAAARVEVGGDAARRVRRAPAAVLGRADQHVRPAVGQDVLELAAPELRVDGHERDAGLQRGDDGDAGLERGLGPDRDALGALATSRRAPRRPRAARRRSAPCRRPTRRAPLPARGQAPAEERSTPDAVPAYPCGPFLLSPLLARHQRSTRLRPAPSHRSKEHPDPMRSILRIAPRTARDDGDRAGRRAVADRRRWAARRPCARASPLP